MEDAVTPIMLALVLRQIMPSLAIAQARAERQWWRGVSGAGRLQNGRGVNEVERHEARNSASLAARCG